MLLLFIFLDIDSLIIKLVSDNSLLLDGVFTSIIAYRNYLHVHGLAGAHGWHQGLRGEGFL